MSGFETLPGGFVAPVSGGVEAAGYAAEPARRAEPARAAVLGRGTDVLPLAAALAGRLRRERGARAAVLARWSDSPDSEDLPWPATPAARRLAEKLAANGCAAVARGRLALVALDPDPLAAAESFDRIAARFPEPLVLAIEGARAAALDAALSACGYVVLAIASQPTEVALALSALAASSLPGGVRVEEQRSLHGLTRRRALAGWHSLPAPERTG